MRRSFAWSLLAAFCLTACTALASSAPPDPSHRSAGVASAHPEADGSWTMLALETSDPLRLVTLGDSYTAGTYLPIPRRDSWPAQLEEALQGDLRLDLVANVAAPNSTSGSVLDDQLWGLESHRPDVVTLLVGASDIIAPDVSLEDYRGNVGDILDLLLLHVPAHGIFVITTPDFTLTRPGGDPDDRSRMAAEVDEANAILAEEAGRRGITLIDISPISDRVPEDPTLVLDDGFQFDPAGQFVPLWPSAKQYAAWVELIGPVMRSVLLDAAP